MTLTAPTSRPQVTIMGKGRDEDLNEGVDLILEKSVSDPTPLGLFVSLNK